MSLVICFGDIKLRFAGLSVLTLGLFCLFNCLSLPAVCLLPSLVACYFDCESGFACINLFARVEHYLPDHPLNKPAFGSTSVVSVQFTLQMCLSAIMGI